MLKELFNLLLRSVKEAREIKSKPVSNEMRFPKPRRKVDRVFIHCSAASRKNIDAKEIDQWHKQRGWREIGYHYFIKTDGTLELGRDINLTPAAQAGHNAGTIAICLNGLYKKDFTIEQIFTLRELCRLINEAYEGKITFHGHKEVSNKSCPVFDYKDVLKLNRNGKLGI
jgi:N-acetylmuramoyl-L-alanine amidase